MRRIEVLFGSSLLLLFSICFFLPELKQDQNYHNFADTRAFFGIPNTMDTLSNVAFLLPLLFWITKKTTEIQQLSLKISTNIFLIGMLLTSFGSMYYHLNPIDETLVYDRLGMSVAFTGVLGMLVACRVSNPMSFLTLIFLIIFAPLSVIIWKISGNLAYYAVLQFGGILLILLTLFLTKMKEDEPKFIALLIFYGLAKLTEAFDVQIFNLTFGIISGHTLKHLLVAYGVFEFIKVYKDKTSKTVD